MWNRLAGTGRAAVAAAALSAALSATACSGSGRGEQIAGALLLSVPEEVTRETCYDPGAGFPQRVYSEMFTLTINPLLLIGVPGPLAVTGHVDVDDPGTRVLFDGAPVGDVNASPPREVTGIQVIHDMQAPVDRPVVIRMEFFLVDGSDAIVAEQELELVIDPMVCSNPEVGTVVFSNRPPSGAPETDSEIWTLDIGTSAATPLTANQQIEDVDPAWSPGRDEIAFLSNRQDPDRVNFDLVVMEAAGGAQTPVTDLDMSGESAGDPAWSPVAGQRRIAFSRGPTGFGDGNIWILDLDQPVGSAGRLRQLTTGGNDDWSPAWSPDGERIAFARGGTIHVVPADGSAAPTPIYTADSVAGLDWGPEGIVFDLYSFATSKARLARVDETGGGFGAVTTGGTHLSDHAPAWSATSDYVIFVRQPGEDGDDRLRTVAAEGGASEEVPGQPEGDNHDPDW
jgi:dipeptidyl aminopeptidase/acylaminoacyl peptidase